MHAFFDDSDSFGQSGFICLVGYMADDSRWDSFNQEWCRALGKHKIRSLHTSDFLSGKGAEYAALALTYEQRCEAIRDFILVIRRNILCGVAVGVDSTAYRSVFANETKKMDANVFAFRRVLKRTVAKAVEWNATPISLVFDDAEATSMRFYDAYRTIKRYRKEVRDTVASLAFANDLFVTPLQAADLLACVTVRENKLGSDSWMDDSPFKEILLDPDPIYGLPYEQERWDEAELRNASRTIVNLASDDA